MHVKESYFLPHLSRLSHLPGVPHLHVNGPLEVIKSCTAIEILHSLCFFISPGYYSRPKRNWRKCSLCKILGANKAYGEMCKWQCGGFTLKKNLSVFASALTLCSGNPILKRLIEPLRRREPSGNNAWSPRSAGYEVL